MEDRKDLSGSPCGDCSRESQLAGSVPFVSHRPGSYRRLLLAVYVRWKMGLLVASDGVLLRGRAGGWPHQSQSAVRLTSDD